MAQTSKEILKVLAQLPRLDCGHCGHKSCTELANRIVAGEKKITDCYILQQKQEVAVSIDNKSVPLHPFVQDIVRNTVFAMLKSLKQTSIDGDEYLLITVKKKDAKTVKAKK
jgi:CO dehydrogenase/acetyl-CoA synthase gamma subunit (corrinoid Fe-S protein)